MTLMHDEQLKEQINAMPGYQAEHMGQEVDFQRK